MTIFTAMRVGVGVEKCVKALISLITLVCIDALNFSRKPVKEEKAIYDIKDP